jgi:homoserine kinase
VALSGAGPTVLAFARTEDAGAVGEAITRVFNNHGVAATPHVANVDTQGRVERTASGVFVK